MDLQEKIKNVPFLPGVYLMKSAKGAVLYIGKARSLKDRVRSYFQKNAPPSPRIASMIRQVADLEVIVTGSELEALILENTLVKKHKPRYNVVLRDDKTYPFLRLSIGDLFPRITVVRRVRHDGALYFGPYVPVHALRDTLRMIKRTFPLATCKLDLTKRYDRACVEFEIKRCVAPCIRAVDPEGYATVVQQVHLFLEGKDRELLSSLKQAMRKAADRHDFEEAARIRDRIWAVESVLEKQRIVSIGSSREMDVIGLAREGDAANLQVLFFRGGMLVGRKDIPCDRVKGSTDEEIIHSFLEQFYSRDVLIPEEIVLPAELSGKEVLEAWLTERRGGRAAIVVPARGRKRELVMLARENAVQSLKGQLSRRREATGALEVLRDLLSLPGPPERIEGFDISNIQGVHAVGSMVVWEGGKMKKDDYRHFRIRTVSGADDFAMMQEVIDRRYAPLAEAGEPFPDLIVVDGGKGQLNAAVEVFNAIGIAPSVIGLAKEREGENGVIGDRVFLPGESEAIPLDPVSPATPILQMIRDEAHRFAVRYHRKLRGKEGMLSELDGISGIGKVRKLALLRYFGSLDRIMTASREEVLQVPKMTRKAADEVWEALHPPPFSVKTNGSHGAL